MAVGLPVGLVLCFLTPPFQVPDEPWHFARAYQLSEGTLFGTRWSPTQAGGELPTSLWRVIRRTHVEPGVAGHPGRRYPARVIPAALEIPLLPEQRERRHFPATILYAPVVYLPQSAAIALGRVARAPPLALLYLGRVTNLLCFLLLIAWAVERTPAAPWVFAAVALTPMALFEAASVAADPVVLAISAVFLAELLRLAHGPAQPDLDPGRPDLRPAAGLVGLAALLGLCKGVYLPLVALAVAVPASRLGGRPRRAAWLLAVAGAGTAATLLWSAAALQTYAPALPLAMGRVAPDEQLLVILGDPLRFGALAEARWLDQGGAVEMVRGAVGILGWLDLAPHPALAIGYLALLTLAARCPGAERGDGPTLAERAALLAAVGVVAALVTAAQYMIWTPVGADRIDGLQGRYFLPVLALPFLAIRPAPRSGASRWAPLAITAGLAAVGLVTILLVARRYYGP